MTYSNADALVTTDWLSDHLGDQSIRIVEVDEETALYEKDHIPGAIAWSWSEDLEFPPLAGHLDYAAMVLVV